MIDLIAPIYSKVSRITEKFDITGSVTDIASGVETELTSTIGSSGRWYEVKGGIITGVQNLSAEKSVTVKIYLSDGANGWYLVDITTLNKDTGKELYFGRWAHNEYSKITISHNDAGNNRSFSLKGVGVYLE